MLYSVRKVHIFALSGGDLDWNFDFLKRNMYIIYVLYQDYLVFQPHTHKLFTATV